MNTAIEAPAAVDEKKKLKEIADGITFAADLAHDRRWEAAGKPMPYDDVAEQARLARASTVKRTIFDIAGDAMALNDLLDELQGDISGEGDAEAIDEWLNETGEAMEKKLGGYRALILENATRAENLKAEVKSINELAKLHQSRAERLKERMKYFMETHGEKKIPVNRGEFAICGNGGKEPLIVDLEAEDLPEEFRKVEYKPDNDAIRAALEAGQALPFARLAERGTYLRVK